MQNSFKVPISNNIYKAKNLCHVHLLPYHMLSVAANVVNCRDTGRKKLTNYTFNRLKLTLLSKRRLTFGLLQLPLDSLIAHVYSILSNVIKIW